MNKGLTQSSETTDVYHRHHVPRTQYRSDRGKEEGVHTPKKVK